MALLDFLYLESIILQSDVSSKKQAFTELSKQAVFYTNLEERIIFDGLLEREKLGTTGLGNGVAIPHGRFKDLSHIVGILMTLQTPIDFDSVDRRPVDIIFLLLAPEDAGAEHLQILSKISKLLRKKNIRGLIRTTQNPDDIIKAIEEYNSFGDYAA